MHRIPVPRPLRRDHDPADSDDAQVRELVGELAQLRLAPDPDPRFRAELRTQLVAVTPRLVAEGATDTETDGRAAGARHTDDRLARRGIRWRRVAAGLVSVVVVLGLVLGVAVWLSRDALPGDALYGLKRTSERVQLFFASSDTNRAKDYLQFAQRRADEVDSLLHRDSAAASGIGLTAAGVSAQTAKLVNQTLDSADSDTRSAMRLLSRQVAHQKSAQPLGPMRAWAPPQLDRLQDIAKTTPAGVVRQRVDQSVDVIKQVWTRTLALDTTATCSCTGTAGSDLLGPKPCLACAAPSRPGGATGSTASTAPAAPGASGPGSRPAGNGGNGGGATGGGARGGAGGATGAGGSGAAPTSAGGGAAGGGAPGSNVPGGAGRTSSTAAPAPSSSRARQPVHLPSLPIPVPSVSIPVDADSCSVSIDAGPLHIAVTVCPSPPGGR